MITICHGLFQTLVTHLGIHTIMTILHHQGSTCYFAVLSSQPNKRVKGTSIIDYYFVCTAVYARKPTSVNNRKCHNYANETPY